MSKILKKWFVDGVMKFDFFNNQEITEICFASTNSFYRLTVHLSISCLNIFLLFWVLKLEKSHFFSKNDIKSKHHLTEKIIGSVSILIFIVQAFLKLFSQSLIFIFNPCHTAMIVIAILGLSSKKRYFLYNYLNTLLLGAFLGLMFPTISPDDNLTENFVFYSEHSLPLVASAFFYILHYSNTKWSSLRWHFIGIAQFSLYQRLFLWPLSEIAFVNLNYVICGSPADPVYKYFGFLYLIFSELYLSLASYIVRCATIYPIDLSLRIVKFTHKSKPI